MWSWLLLVNCPYYSYWKTVRQMNTVPTIVFVPLALQVNCLDPGTVNTKMLLAGWGPCGINVSGADNQLHLATDPSTAMVSGKYFVG